MCRGQSVESESGSARSVAPGAWAGLITRSAQASFSGHGAGGKQFDLLQEITRSRTRPFVCQETLLDGSNFVLGFVAQQTLELVVLRARGKVSEREIQLCGGINNSLPTGMRALKFMGKVSSDSPLSCFGTQAKRNTPASGVAEYRVAHTHVYYSLRPAPLLLSEDHNKRTASGHNSFKQTHVPGIPSSIFGTQLGEKEKVLDMLVLLLSEYAPEFQALYVDLRPTNFW